MKSGVYRVRMSLRGTWSISPVTRVKKSKKIYSRKGLSNGMLNRRILRDVEGA